MNLNSKVQTLGVDTIVYGFDKSPYVSDSKIEEQYDKATRYYKDKYIQDKLFKASLCDPRRSDIYFTSQDQAVIGEEIAKKLHNMTTEEFRSKPYSYEWLFELKGESILKVVNKNVLEAT